MDPIAATWTAGTVLRIGRAAGVQYSDDRALTIRVVAVDPRPTYQGSAWVTGYVLNRRGDATAKRELYIDVTAGVEVLSTPAARPASGQPRPQATRVPPRRAPTNPPHHRGGPGRGDRSAGRGLDQTTKEA
ncbi:hypothetical protein [Micromonospora aurantiaca (nom. illeg.)]|uniref:hypothetical protein n=1 Tax=Micromonospora aurantiaca (nom. illeg.) TaxID=47850 RepID=UPI003F4A5EB2